MLCTCRRSYCTSEHTTASPNGSAQMSDSVPAEDIEKLRQMLEEKEENLEKIQLKANDFEVRT